ncbi:hypothetical protein LCI18_008205 [Fusarium solani-melongenae]|uniref:Uncharacterized protein n=1 Tax=Fusarium solani subsp. cucurbitae TaxID=2747967 RepID=A0ACD3Z834_FUSSC|nr:hypothetical protein LCI18_008205 [Fusarium solani-melongenae]
MAPTEFRFFPSLPLELRRDIYLLASPPRDDFCEKLHTTVNPIKLDSSLKDFAFSWRHIIHGKSKQPTLESFGFTSSKPLTHSWEPSSFTPEISLDRLCENPGHAWELARTGHFFSKAPIPALLHTCTESRLELINMGYQLAFQTRSSGPRTWFNFDRDILFIESDPSGDGSSVDDTNWILSGNSLWNLGQFDPREMRQVRRLALWKAAEYLSLVNHGLDSFDVPARELSSVLRLFSSLEELLLVELCADELATTVAKAKDEVETTTSLATEQRQHHTFKTRELWSCIDVCEVDGLLPLFSPKPPCPRNMSATGVNSDLLIDHKKAQGNGANYFGDTEDVIQSVLAKDIASLISTEKTDIVIPWHIPRLRTVHVLPPLEHSILSQERVKVAQDVCKLQQEWASLVRSRTEKPLSPTEWDKAARVFEDAHWPDDKHRDHEGYSSCYVSGITQKKWWIQEGPAPEVGDLLL